MVGNEAASLNDLQIKCLLNQTSDRCLQGRHSIVMKIYKVKGEGRTSQLSIMLHITLMHNMFRLKSKTPSSGEIRVTHKSHHVLFGTLISSDGGFS